MALDFICTFCRVPFAMFAPLCFLWEGAEGIVALTFLISTSMLGIQVVPEFLELSMAVPSVHLHFSASSLLCAPVPWDAYGPVGSRCIFWF